MLGQHAFLEVFAPEPLTDFTASFDAGGPLKGEAAADPEAGYEAGYKAGWDDAVRSEAENFNRVGTELARSLSDLKFTFHEARLQVMRSLEPLLQELLQKFLPELVESQMGNRIMAEIRQMTDRIADSPIQILVAGEERVLVERMLALQGVTGFVCLAEESLAPGQVLLRGKDGARLLDFAGAFAALTQALSAMLEETEMEERHA